MTEESPSYLPQIQPKALRLADEVDEVALTYPDMAEVSAELRHLYVGNQTLQAGYDAARLEIESLKARVQELAAMLDAVGAGGVEPLLKRECLHQIQEPPATSLPSYLGGASEKLSQAARQVVKTLQAAAQPASQPSPAPQLASLAADAREIFCDYPTKAQRAVDEVIEWFSASINVEIYKAEAAQPIAPRSTTEESSAVKALATTGIDSPFNACMYQEQCKRWRNAAVRQPLTEDQIAEIYAYNKINPMRFARAIEAAHGITGTAAPTVQWLAPDDTEGGAA